MAFSEPSLVTQKTDPDPCDDFINSNVKQEPRTDDDEPPALPCGEFNFPTAAEKINPGDYLLVEMNEESSDKPTPKSKRRSETENPAYLCKDCGNGFKRLVDLAIHRRSHVPKKVHQCGICKKTFSKRYLLREHERTHTGEKPFECGICERNFTSKRYLNYHKEHVHSKEKVCLKKSV